MKIDLRSDTVTLPTLGMRAAMDSAELGDDVYGEDATVNKLEAKVASMFGREAALFCPTGTMTNQLAIRVHAKPGDEVICDKLAHIYLYEGGGIALNAFASVRPLDGDLGRITAEMVEQAINNPHDIHQPITKLVCLENTVNKGGGSIYDFNDIKEIRAVCKKHDLILHLDGARLFNALVETDQTPQDYGDVFDSISICLSKGLGCPVGSLLVGSNELIYKARRFRKVMGGGWRQAGALAAAGIYALDNHVERLKEDHANAKAIAHMLQNNSHVKSTYPVATNIVMAELGGSMNAAAFVSKLGENGIRCVAFGKDLVRFVTHLDINAQQLEMLETKLKF